jgi:hypothetical protein
MSDLYNQKHKKGSDWYLSKRGLEIYNFVFVIHYPSSAFTRDTNVQLQSNLPHAHTH